MSTSYEQHGEWYHHHCSEPSRMVLGEQRQAEALLAVLAKGVFLDRLAVLHTRSFHFFHLTISQQQWQALPYPT